MAIDRHILLRALRALLWDESEPACIQVFAEATGCRVRPEHRSGRLRDLMRWADGANDAGAGVYWTVQATDGGRRAEHVVGVRTLFVDLDGAEYPWRWHLEPSLVVESSPGRWHAYWSVGDTTRSGWGAPVDPMPIAELADAQRRLAALYGGDPSVHDAPRVLRLPGSMHRKRTPWRVRIVSTAAWGAYRWQDVLADVPVLPAPPPRPTADAVAARAAAVPGGMVAGIDVATLDIVRLMADAGHLRDVERVGGYAVDCPWAHEHTGPSAPTGAMVWPAGARGALPGFRCMHAHCAGRGIADVMRLFRAHLDAYASPLARPHRAIERAERLRGHP
jgi:hypothetical protein